ncbi:hypothetical protein MKN04_19130 [Paenibacillus polymyxa]|uniref:hypothetical protein n=1 Tax=Paenibacillus polymyxa TaxID=1406 RepID=UPI0012D3603D|nr:hypothetical protein [Paenibacillus polymyxa]MCH6189761.1 hypothetical protein [Paenibacillus polymyxa]WRL61109.1 hypothetical protein U3G77_23950 [Paenibacillus polymyxa]
MSAFRRMKACWHKLSSSNAFTSVQNNVLRVCRRNTIRPVAVARHAVQRALGFAQLCACVTLRTDTVAQGFTS